MGLFKKIKGLKDKKWFQTLTGIAPMIATGLGGPMAGLAMNVLSQATGISDEDELEAALATGDPDIYSRIKAADQAFKIKLEELDISRDQLVYEDIQSARQMHAAQMEHTPSVLSYLSMVIFFGVVALVVTQPQFFTESTLAQNVAYMVIGASIGWVEKAYSFWLGSSRGSKSKSDAVNAILDKLSLKE